MKRRLSDLSSNLPDVYNAKKPKSKENNIEDINAPHLLTVLPSDTALCLEVLRRNFPRGPTITSCPIIIKSQVLYSVMDHSVVDREISDMHNAGVIRLFKFGSDDVILFLDDYKQLISKIYEQFIDSDPELARMVKIFQEEVCSKVKDQCITKDHAIKVFQVSHGDKLMPLVRHGLLGLNDAQSYKITVPNFGLFWKWVVRGRQELISFVTKQRHKEISQADLEQKKLTSSPLGALFHIKDLVGLKQLERFSSSSGNWLRIKPNAVPQ